MSSGLYNNWLAETEGYYNQYHGNTSFNGTTTKAILGQTVTITDTSNKLSAYQSFSQTKDGVTFSHNQGSNDLTISVSNDCTADIISFNSRDYGLYQLMPNGSQYNSSTMSNYMYFTFTSGTVQNLMFSNYVDPSAFSINVQVEYGNALLIKTNSVGNTLSGAKFGLYKDSNCTNQVRTGISNSNGQIEFNRLAPGTYYVKELSVPNGYLLDTSVQSVEIRVNETYCPSDKVNPVQEFYVKIDKNSSGAIKELIENDTPFQSYIKIIKVDKKTGKQVTILGQQMKMLLHILKQNLMQEHIK